MAKHRKPVERTWTHRVAMGAASTLCLICMGLVFAATAEAKTHHGAGAPGNPYSAPTMMFSATSIVEHHPNSTVSGGTSTFTTGTGAYGTGKSTTSIIKSNTASTFTSGTPKVSGGTTGGSTGSGLGAGAGTDTAGSVVHTPASLGKPAHKH